MWRRGLVPASLSLILGVVLAFHRLIPNVVGNLGSLVETFLPWFGWAILPLALWAGLRKAPTAGIVLLIPTLVWALMYAELLPDKSDGEGNLRVVTHNVGVSNPDPKDTVATLVGSGADVVALQEVSEEAQGQYEKAMSATYPHNMQQGTVSLWSKHPITDSGPVDIGIGWTRAIWAKIDTGKTQVAFYVAHLASVRVSSNGFASSQRDDTAEALGSAIAQEELDAVVLLGDLNGTMQDRSLAPLAAQLDSTQAAAGEGFGFTWPAEFPMARIDQILTRGVTPVSSWTLRATGSDHLPAAADLRV
ncbi:endonuclease/exonuclease/phosphatase family protein [Stackebrandtia nassauensis]|uniref:Endonuclease/exonuclease/phosphatase n=1 Tax=Stackebrandtia nassauensis (strain DSM 44728 / CIP 108903 / NRRL B-16338 / NBRC 102104 / LLR-40K-21) TaxID=446470 RepID=D3Q2A8_STANL|nr:endonuclease/exonuclease/phosphatase family protein [Stackebrandtia nassauensis]ADD43841.1 Endonuclease/exonuclease/phosphatase [Stackebrandtia nassauensis DSM 44728]